MQHINHVEGAMVRPYWLESLCLPILVYLLLPPTNPFLLHQRSITHFNARLLIFDIPTGESTHASEATFSLPPSSKPRKYAIERNPPCLLYSAEKYRCRHRHCLFFSVLPFLNFLFSLSTLSTFSPSIHNCPRRRKK